MRINALLAALAALTLATAPAAAETPDAPQSTTQDAAERLYASGQYMAAAEAAAAEPSSPRLAFAARALMAACITAPGRADLDATLDRVEAAAREALAMDPHSVEARLQWALALGVRGRRANLGEAVARNYAPRGHRLIEQAIALAPEDAWAHALMGAWHLEVLRRGGRAGAALYGARLRTGLAQFDQAHTLAPDDALIALQYAVALVELDPVQYSARAADLLREAQAHRPHDAFEAHALTAGRIVARALAEHGPQAAQTAAREAFL